MVAERRVLFSGQRVLAGVTLSLFQLRSNISSLACSFLWSTIGISLDLCPRDGLSRDYVMACEQLRTVGLSNSAPEKLARLLLDWSQNGQTTDGGTHFRFPLTHGEIGEFIGASRETVTRTLSVFKSRHLVAFHGSTLTIPSKRALENYAHC
jgi:CRP-like cAMP-binding protein